VGGAPGGCLVRPVPADEDRHSRLLHRGGSHNHVVDCDIGAVEGDWFTRPQERDRLQTFV
jgi:hypothetical protein